MPNEFTVVGEDKEDDTHLLVVGADGNYYGYFLDQERLVPVEPDDRWLVFASAEAIEDVALAKEGGQV